MSRCLKASPDPLLADCPELPGPRRLRLAVQLRDEPHQTPALSEPFRPIGHPPLVLRPRCPACHTGEWGSRDLLRQGSKI